MRLARIPAAALAVAALAGATGAPLAAPAPAQAASVVDVIAQRGFGSVRNNYAWGMAWFKGSLYVGTGRYVSCVEAATTDFYFPVAEAYRTYMAPNQHCPPDRWSMDLRAEIWRFTPGTGRWTRVYRSPTVPNPRAPGKRVARDIAYRGMSVRKDPDGHEALFISGVSATEMIPEIARTSPPRLLRTYDGRRFTDIARTFIVNKSGEFSDKRVVGFRGLTWWRNRLYVLASTGYSGDGGVFEVRDPWRRSKPSRFRQITPSWMNVFETQAFDGDLYIGTGSRRTGYSVWKAQRTTKPYRMKPVVTGGAGRGPLMTGVIAMHPFRGRLYVSAVSWYATNELPTTEMIRISKSGKWQVVVGRPRVGKDKKYRYPLSGLMDGFENIFMPHIWRIASANGGLYAGTLDWSYMLQNSKDWPPDDRPNNDQFAGLLSQVVLGELGFDMWSTCDGIDWFPVTRNSFNGDMYDFGLRTMVPGGKSMYLGTANHVHGARVFRSDARDCDPLTDGRGPVRALAKDADVRPEHLLADVQRGGTVLSWEPGRTPARYEVVRSTTTNVPLSFRFPRAMPNGFWFEGALPELVPEGTPDSKVLDVPLPDKTTTIGTTTGAVFVDRTRLPGVSYRYQVIARDARGRRIASNFQVVPDPRPQPTFRELLKLLPPTARAASATDDALEAWSAAKRADALAQVERVSRTAPSEEARELARRLARRLQYAGLADGTGEGG